MYLYFPLHTTGNFEHGTSGDIRIHTGDMQPKRSIEGRPGEIILQSGSAGDKDVYHYGANQWYGYRTRGNSNIQSRGGGLKLSSGESFDGAGGDVSIASGVGLYEGGTINMTSGFGVRSKGGSFHIAGGTSRDKEGGDLSLSAGASSSSNSGSVLIGGGRGLRTGSVSLVGSQAKNGDGGDVLITSGSSTKGKSGDIVIESSYSDFGNGQVSVKSNGKTDISGEHSWLCKIFFLKMIKDDPHTFSPLNSATVGQSMLIHSSSATYAGNIEISTTTPKLGDAGDVKISSGNSGEDRSGDSSASGSIALSSSPSSYSNSGNTGTHVSTVVMIIIDLSASYTTLYLLFLLFI